MIVAEAVGRALAACGAETVFGVVGSGNFHVTNALVAAGARFVAARHEGGAATMADAYARMSGRAGIVSVHQGPGLTNALTGIAEAAKSRTPLIVLAGEATDRRSNFSVDQDALAAAVGAVPMRVAPAEGAWEQAVEAYRVAVEGRRTVLLNLPLDVQAMPCDPPAGPTAAGGGESGVSPARGAAVEELARLLSRSRRPVFIAGRGARRARRELEALADRAGALLATSAVAKGLFRGSPWDLDVSGGFATPLAAELIRGADLVVGWGCALNMWTTRHGSLIPQDGKVAQVDLDRSALGAHVPVDLGVTGDVAAVATALAAQLTTGGVAPDTTGAGPAGAAGYRSPELARRIQAEGRWRDVPYADESGGGRIDPRTLTIGLDDLLPIERILSIDSGNFMGYPSMFLDIPDERGFCFTQAFQSIGLGLATAIGAALAQPDRLPVAALGDGGALMGAAELETVVRLGLPMVIVIYDDEAYGAEVHHFGPHGHPLDTVTFPPADLAAIARGHGFAAVTVTTPADLAGVADWLKGGRDRPLLVHAKVTRNRGSWWLEEAFKGH
ncbi:thiamine pyrophosphate-dependent acetolactate synthase large subunit-like protein [Nonomuraea polychroma]|uniref:Thiamine pyrophosphate-dependent acetolactate synthase large subunit-like protein n=1 Tax=Nonomuraea polychroma TaxID=46176 RepID=A0A438M1H6_9ACTN|nr:thiamine pyrophosphate-binding protein [Nonomuraea polychroma]RVX39676.1 thiamine pyrophosphate-dependent acetolactate synthase large subunit-like protein [Nonomuraea polychroma]